MVQKGAADRPKPRVYVYNTKQPLGKFHNMHNNKCLSKVAYKAYNNGRRFVFMFARMRRNVNGEQAYVFTAYACCLL